jgi:uncharacterized protein with ParB-like and HNH nuclease domain
VNFNTANDTFRKLLGNGLTYYVPPFQRDYSWGPDEWEDLWQDISSLFEEDGEPAHYMGYLVLQSKDSKQFQIIDGQQRMTTLSLLILAVLKSLKDLIDANPDSLDDKVRLDNLQSSYIGFLDPVSLESKTKLQLNRHNHKFYKNFLVKLGKLPQRNLRASEHQLRKGFQWFHDKLKKQFKSTVTPGMALASFVDAFVDKLIFTVITVDDELNAFKVFETLNARGVKLSSTDLLKNYLFATIAGNSNTHESELNHIEDRWEQIVEQLGPESFPEFLRVYWNSRNKLVRKTDLFKTIRRRVSSREQAYELINDLIESAEVYAALRDAGDARWNSNERRALGFLAMFNVRQHLPLLLTCYDKFFEPNRKVFSRILKDLSVIAFRYNVICNRPANEQERIFNLAAQSVFNNEAQLYDGVRDSLSPIYVEDDEFRSAFSHKELRTTSPRNKKIVRYILFEIEKQRAENSFDIEDDSITLEHVLPESPGENWSHLDEGIQNRLIYRLGNITLLKGKPNRKAGNQAYETKRSLYLKSGFQITRSIAERYQTWDESKVDARQKRMADVATSIWRI